VRQAARQLTQLYDDALAGTGLRITQYSVLARLSKIEPATMQELADDLVLDRTTLSHNLKPLQREGLVSVGAAEGDQRVRHLQVTKAGKAALRSAEKAWQGAQQKFEKAFGAEPAATLRRELLRAVEAAS
jgi:DNA-binding MarR family transcriptional regulator